MGAGPFILGASVGIVTWMVFGRYAPRRNPPFWVTPHDLERRYDEQQQAKPTREAKKQATWVLRNVEIALDEAVACRKAGDHQCALDRAQEAWDSAEGVAWILPRQAGALAERARNLKWDLTTRST